MFHIGQKVVCIADYSSYASEQWARDLCAELPIQNDVYTVRRVVQRPSAGGDTATGIMLEEILNMKTRLDKEGQGGVTQKDDRRLMKEPDEMAFDARDFRPLVSLGQFVTTEQKVPA